MPNLPTNDDPQATQEGQRTLGTLIRLLIILSVLAGIIAGVTLASLRWFELLDPSEYPNRRIVLEVAAIAVGMPLMMSVVFWSITREWMRIWYERLGFLMLFVVVPIIIGRILWEMVH